LHELGILALEEYVAGFRREWFGNHREV